MKHKGRGLEYTTHNGHPASIEDNRSVVVVVARRWLSENRYTRAGVMLFTADGVVVVVAAAVFVVGSWR